MFHENRKSRFIKKIICAKITLANKLVQNLGSLFDIKKVRNQKLLPGKRFGMHICGQNFFW